MNTANVNSLTRASGFSPEANYSAGAIVDGFSESASPIETTRPTSRNIEAFFPPFGPLALLISRLLGPTPSETSIIPASALRSR